MFTPVLAKHTKSFNLLDTLSVGVDRIQRNFERLQRQVEAWRQTQITDDTARLIFYQAFIDGKLEVPRNLLPEVHAPVFRAAVPGICGQDDVARTRLRNKTHRILEAVAIYTKHGKRVIQESITVDSDCYVGRKAIKIRALVEGQTTHHSFYISDLLADNGKQEIQDAINANTKQ